MKNNKIILKITLLLMGFSMLVGCKAANKKDAKVMADYLDTIISGSRYGVYDLNNDGAFELVIAENDSHADSVDVVTIDKKTREAKLVGSFGSFGAMMCCPKERFILDYYLGQGVTDMTVYELLPYSVNIVHTFWDNSGTLNDTYEFTVDGKQVSEEEYNDIYNNYQFDDEIYIGFNDLHEVEDHEANLKYIMELMEDKSSRK